MLLTLAAASLLGLGFAFASGKMAGGTGALQGAVAGGLAAFGCLAIALSGARQIPRVSSAGPI